MVNDEDIYYDPDTGKLFREIKATREDIERDIERVARTSFKGLQRQITHVIFYLMTGRFPKDGYIIDHKDGRVGNNSWTNLREVTPQQNVHNSLRSRGDAGLEMGVELTPFNRYRVKIRGKHIGTFLTKEEANAQALAARVGMYGEFDYYVSKEASK